MKKAHRALAKERAVRRPRHTSRISPPTTPNFTVGEWHSNTLSLIGHSAAQKTHAHTREVANELWARKICVEFRFAILVKAKRYQIGLRVASLCCPRLPTNRRRFATPGQDGPCGYTMRLINARSLRCAIDPPIRQNLCSHPLGMGTI